MNNSTTSPPTADELRASIAALTGADPADLTGDANLVYLGLGSLEIMRLVTRWRRAGIAVEFRALAAAPTIGAWQAHLEAAWAARQAGAE